ncbi:MAG: acyloxyacyl hydrolase [Pyrinomonadaceae bacterium]
MKIYLGQLFLSCLCCLFLAISVAAQTSDEGKNEFSIWGGFSPKSSTVIRGTGRTPDARFGVVNFRYARRFNNNDTVNLKYTLDVTPVAILNYPDFDYIQISPTVFQKIRSKRETRYGFGLSPLGLQINFRPRKKLQPFIEGTGGLLYFNKNTPNAVGKRFNFTADVGAGLEYQLENGKAVTFGYKYFHISNGNRGQENPGFDNNLFYIGYTFLKK